MRKLNVALMVVLLAVGFAEGAFGQTKDFRLEPSGVQLELSAGHSSTTAFLIKAGSIGVLHDRLFLSIADWEFNKMGVVCCLS